MSEALVWKLATLFSVAGAAAVAVHPLRASRAASSESQPADDPRDAPSGFAREPLATTPAMLQAWIADLRTAHSGPGACRAVTQLEFHRTPVVTEALIDVARSPYNTEGRRCAVRVLGRTGGEAAREALGAIAADSHDAVAQDALLALAASDEAASRAVVFAIARGDDHARSLDALVALGHAQVHAATALIAQAIAGAEPRDAARLIAALGEGRDVAAEPTLLALSRAPDPVQRSAAIAALGALATDGAMARLRELVDGASWTDVPEAINALALIGDEAASDVIIAATSSTRSRTAQAAFGALRQLDTEHVHAFVLAQLQGTTLEGRYWAIDYVTRYRVDDAVPALIALAGGGDARAANGVFAALARFDDPLARQFVLDSASRPGPLRSAALGAVDQLGLAPSRSAALLLAAVRDERGDVQERAILALRGTTDPEAIRVLSDLASHGSDSVGRAAMHALILCDGTTTMRELALHAASAETRSEALRRLAESDDPERGRVFDQLLHDGDDQLRLTALEGLLTMGGPDAERAIDETLTSRRSEDRSTLATVLSGERTPQAAAALEQLVRDADPSVARAALGSLVANAPERAPSLIAQAMRSPDEAIRLSALQYTSGLALDRVRDVLLAGARDPSDDVRATAIAQMAEDPQYERVLAEALTDANAGPLARVAAAQALAALGGETAARYRDAIARANPDAESDAVVDDTETDPN